MRVFYHPSTHGSFLSKEESHHVKHVTRHTSGDTLTGFDGEGTEYTLRILEHQNRYTKVDVVHQQHFPLPGYSVTLIFSLFSPQRLEWAIEKATEVGVTSFIFTSTDYSQYPLSLGEKKYNRFRRITIAACKQAERTYLPAISLQSFEEVVKRHRGFVGMAYNARRMSEISRSPTLSTLLIGPEGGFSPDEEEQLLSQFTPLTLGPHVQRAETAAVVGPALLLNL
jgi:16S rRNA (uracil1498-N3)-methyltransferase